MANEIYSRAERVARASFGVPRTQPEPTPTLLKSGRARWRHLLTPPASGAWNMALDDALLARARASGETVLRVYSWSSPTLSLGRNQTALGCYDLDRARALGVDIVRRPTGGRAVLHHREITYSVTAPSDSADLADSYRRINQILLRGLQAIGVDAHIAEARGTSPPPNSSPCFEVPTAGELTLGGRKLAGSAQFREEGALLQHGSILVDDDQPLIAKLATRPLPPIHAPATLHEALGRVPASDELFQALVGAVENSEDADASPLILDDWLLQAANTRELHYRSPTWTWRR